MRARICFASSVDVQSRHGWESMLCVLIGRDAVIATAVPCLTADCVECENNVTKSR